MNDTVKRIMWMVDLLCSACVNDVCAGDQAIPNYESNASTLHAALESELTRLFTPLDIQPPNNSGATMCTVRWMAETPNGWVGAYDRAALEQLSIT